jgi:hypothetical protein
VLRSLASWLEGRPSTAHSPLLLSRVVAAAEELERWQV